MDNIKFVSYTGAYPNLCRGILTLIIDGITTKFGLDILQMDKDTIAKVYKNEISNWYQSFWKTGGYAYFDDKYENDIIDTDPWILNINNLPDHLKKYSKELIDIFNENVPYGCCGGCL